MGLAAFAGFVAGVALAFVASGWSALAAFALGALMLVARRRVLRVVVVEPAQAARLELRVLGLVLSRTPLPPGARCIVEYPNDDSADYGMGVARLSLRGGAEQLACFCEAPGMAPEALDAFADAVNARLSGASSASRAPSGSGA